MYIKEFLNIVFFVFFGFFVFFDFFGFFGFLIFLVFLVLNHAALSVRVFSCGEQSAARAVLAFC